MTVCTKDPREDLGHGVTIERRYLDGVLGGVAYWHPRPDGGGQCEGWVSVPDKDGWPPDSWTLVSERPLTRLRLCSAEHAVTTAASRTASGCRRSARPPAPRLQPQPRVESARDDAPRPPALHGHARDDLELEVAHHPRLPQALPAASSPATSSEAKATSSATRAADRRHGRWRRGRRWGHEDILGRVRDHRGGGREGQDATRRDPRCDAGQPVVSGREVERSATTMRSRARSPRPSASYWSVRGASRPGRRDRPRPQKPTGRPSRLPRRHPPSSSSRSRPSRCLRLRTWPPRGRPGGAGSWAPPSCSGRWGPSP